MVMCCGYLKAQTLMLPVNLNDTVLLQETLGEKDTTEIDENLLQKLQPIRENFESINSKNEWDSVVVKKMLIDDRNVRARLFYSEGEIEKIVIRHSVEDHQELTEFYLLNGELSFVYEKEYWYLQYYKLDEYDEKKQKKEKYSIALESSNETKSYFENGILIYKWDKEDCCDPFPKFHLMNEEERITDIFNKIIKQIS